MSRANTTKEFLQARLIGITNTVGEFPLNSVMAPVQSTYIQGLNAKRFANTFGSTNENGIGSVEYTRLIKDIVLSDFTDTDGQPLTEDGTGVANLQFKYQELKKTYIFLNIELTLDKKEKFFEDDLVDSGLLNLVALVMGNIMEAYDVDLQSRRDDLLKVAATTNSHLKTMNFGEMTEEADGQVIYKVLQGATAELVKQGTPSGEANPFHIGLNKSGLVIEVNSWMAIGLQNYLAFVNSKLNKDPHLFQGKIDPEKGNSVLVESDTYLGQIFDVPVYENKWFVRDNSDVSPVNWTEDYFAIYPIAGQGAYGLPMKAMKSKMAPITNISFYTAINTLLQYGLGTIRGETIIFGTKDASLPVATSLLAKDIKGKNLETAIQITKATSNVIKSVNRTINLDKVQPLNITDKFAVAMFAKEAEQQRKLDAVLSTYKPLKGRATLSLKDLLGMINDNRVDNSASVVEAQKVIDPSFKVEENNIKEDVKKKSIKEKINI